MKFREFLNEEIDLNYKRIAIRKLLNDLGGDIRDIVNAINDKTGDKVKVKPQRIKTINYLSQSIAQKVNTQEDFKEWESFLNTLYAKLRTKNK